MKNTNTNIINKERPGVLWSSKAKPVKQNYGKWYSFYDKSISLFEKVLISVSLLFVICNAIKNGLEPESLITMVIVLLFIVVISLVIKYGQKQKFNNFEYIFTKDKIEIVSWNFLSGHNRTIIHPRSITSTYLLGITKNIGTILLYTDENAERSRDLMKGTKLETIAIQYVNNPKDVINLINQLRSNSI